MPTNSTYLNPPNAPSNPGSPAAILETFTSGDVLPAPSVIMVNGGLAYLFDPSTETNYFKIVGVSSNGVLAGATVNVVSEGTLSSPGSFVQDTTYFAGPNGTLISAPPATGICVEIGYAQNTDILIVDIKQPIVLV